ncbi:hypothetical protein [Nocardia nepalensis]|uniref:hypothetical protein n=1 Tax=Nocardia nepalensis TaxID=3375448 RepID=UPI003B6809B0
MPYSLNLASVLIDVRDINDRQIVASTDGHRVRVLIRDAEHPATEWLYADLAPDSADALTVAIATRHRPRPVRWLTLRRWRRAANR